MPNTIYHQGDLWWQSLRDARISVPIFWFLPSLWPYYRRKLFCLFVFLVYADLGLGRVKLARASLCVFPSTALCSGDTLANAVGARLCSLSPAPPHVWTVGRPMAAATTWGCSLSEILRFVPHTLPEALGWEQIPGVLHSNNLATNWVSSLPCLTDPLPHLASWDLLSKILSTPKSLSQGVLLGWTPGEDRYTF